MTEIIPFNLPFVCGEEQHNIQGAMERQVFSGNDYFTKTCERELMEVTGASTVMLTSSCTHALEMCAILLDIKPGDEVIMPSFNFVSAANAFALRGATIVFVDVDETTMNIDSSCIEAAIGSATKAVLIVHYGGIACDMDAILKLTRKHDLYLIEDAAHGMGAYMADRHLGTIGDLGVLSFHATKNIHCGEGGALLINNSKFEKRARIIRDKGTNRYKFSLGLVDKYTWVDLGSSYFMGELSAAFLLAQLPYISEVSKYRRSLWKHYQKAFQSVDYLMIAEPPGNAVGNGHLFYLKCRTQEERRELIAYLRNRGISSYFHYIPLHSSIAGKKYGRFVGDDSVTTTDSCRLLRLPLYYTLSKDTCDLIINHILTFYEDAE